MHNFRELNIWKKGMSVVKKVLKTTETFPNEHKYGLTSQINRSSISIPSNIAEGSARTTDKEFSRYLDIAQGSAYELETQLLISKEINLIDQGNLEEIISELNELQKMITGFKRSIN